MTHWTAICLLLLFCSSAWCLRAQTAGGYQPAVPRVWDDAVLKDLEVPLARSEYSPRHVPASFYYQIPVRQIYKSYPVYHPDREPKGYIEWLRSRDPEIDWDAATLKTKEDWIRAGETVFDASQGKGGPERSPEFRVARAAALISRSVDCHAIGGAAMIPASKLTEEPHDKGNVPDHPGDSGGQLHLQDLRHEADERRRRSTENLGREGPR